VSSLSGTPLGTDPVERFIRRLSNFEPLDPEAVATLRRTIIRGTLLAPMQDIHGEQLQDVSILLSGWVCQFRLLDNGRRQITSIVVPGDFVDFGFLTGNPAQSPCVATAPSQLGRIRLRQFAELSEQFPSVMRASLRAAATDAAIGRERITTLGVRTATERLAYLLCELWYRLAAVGLISAEDSFDLPMTQAELGAVLGLSTVHVNRTVQVLRKSGAVAMQSGKVWMRDLKQLETVAGFDRTYLNATPSPNRQSLT
jgi:CRP-like cAMP-binding protein